MDRMTYTDRGDGKRASIGVYVRLPKDDVNAIKKLADSEGFSNWKLFLNKFATEAIQQKLNSN